MAVQEVEHDGEPAEDACTDPESEWDCELGFGLHETQGVDHGDRRTPIED